jgi:hypothetical protein
MDGSRFDTLSRALVRDHSRRGLTRLLGGLVLGGSLAVRGSPADEAKGKGKKHHKKHRGRSGPTCPEGQKPCQGGCIPSNQCCENSDCPGGRICQSGACVCPPERPLVCPGTSVCAQCCSLDDCHPVGSADGLACQGGQCVCTVAGTRRCPNGACGSCCSDSDCPGAELCVEMDYHDREQHCRCDADKCEISGDWFCVPMGCYNKCGTSCSNPGGYCCGSGAKGSLVCYQTEGGGGTCEV